MPRKHFYIREFPLTEGYQDHLRASTNPSCVPLCRFSYASRQRAPTGHCCKGPWHRWKYHMGLCELGERGSEMLSCTSILNDWMAYSGMQEPEFNKCSTGWHVLLPYIFPVTYFCTVFVHIITVHSGYEVEALDQRVYICLCVNEMLMLLSIATWKVCPSLYSHQQTIGTTIDLNRNFKPCQFKSKSYPSSLLMFLLEEHWI